MTLFIFLVELAELPVALGALVGGIFLAKRLGSSK
jgi:hypothetical protein